MEKIRDLIQQLAGTSAPSAQLVVGTVSDVNPASNTCTVAPMNGDAEYTDVRLTAGEGNGFVIYPLPGSVVVVNKLTEHDAVVVLYSSVDTFVLRNQSESLRTILLDLVEQLLQLKLSTNSGATLQVLTAPTIQPLKQRIQNLFSA